MTAVLAPRHRGSGKANTPLTDLADTFGTYGKRGVAVASATGVALTAVVASTAAAATVPAAPAALPGGDFVANLESRNTATLVSLDLEWESGDTVAVTAEEPPPPPEPEPEPIVEQTENVASRSNTDTSSGSYQEASYSSAPPSYTGGVVSDAMQFLGYPYVFGTQGPSSFDCSGFTSYIYGRAGISLPASSYAQMNMGTPVSIAEAQPGDLVIMTGGGHVGIYIGDYSIIHASNPRDGVKISSLEWFSVDSIRRL